MKYNLESNAKTYSALRTNIEIIKDKSLFDSKQLIDKLEDNDFGNYEESVNNRCLSSISQCKGTGKENFIDILSTLPPDSIICFTDGACSRNPGPSGAGAIVKIPSENRLLERYLALGMNGTNNIAELTAVKMALEIIGELDEEGELHNGQIIHVCTDSKYTIGMLSYGWKAKKNEMLITEIKEILQQRNEKNKILFHWIPGHAGIPGNERADHLANLGVEKSKQKRNLSELSHLHSFSKIKQRKIRKSTHSSKFRKFI